MASLVKKRAAVNVGVDIGLTEAEITEHSIRKIMECIIQDFPKSGKVDMKDEFKSG